jgi:triacylglycerol lipase
MSVKHLTFEERAAFFAKCSELAYLPEKVGVAKFTELGYAAEFIDHDGSQAYYLYNTEDLIFVCRGTEPSEFKDIAADLKAFPVPSSTGIGKVHRGFKESAEDVWNPLLKKLKKYCKKRTIWLCGHSLGAAMATLIAYRLQRSEDLPSPAALFTYGSPKVGNKEYIKGITASGIEHHRFVNGADIVTRVPPWPYQHFGTLHYMNHWGNIRPATAMQQFKDRLRGFWKGIKKGEINYFSNHSMTRYVANLTRWAECEERPQDKI